MVRCWSYWSIGKYLYSQLESMYYAWWCSHVYWSTDINVETRNEAATITSPCWWCVVVKLRSRILLLERLVKCRIMVVMADFSGWPLPKTRKDFACFRNNVLSNLQQGCAVVIFTASFICINKSTHHNEIGLMKKQELFPLILLLPLCIWW